MAIIVVVVFDVVLLLLLLHFRLSSFSLRSL